MDKNSLAKQYALISLNGERTNRKTLTGRMKNRCITAAVFLGYVLEGKLQPKGAGYFWNQSDEALSETEAVLYKALKAGAGSRTITEWMKGIQKISQKRCNQVAEELKQEMKEEGILEEIPSLLECDINYETVDLRVKQYRAQHTFYIKIIEYMKAEVLEEGEISDEVLCLLWLLRLSGDLELVFSAEEMGVMKEKYIRIYREKEFVHQLFEAELKTRGMVHWKRYLAAKKKWAQTPMGVGIVSRFPVLERSESVFIATEKWFPNSKERVEDVRKLLTDKGHICELKKQGTVSLMEVDHVLYELVPDIFSRSGLCVHGVRLRRYTI